MKAFIVFTLGILTAVLISNMTGCHAGGKKSTGIIVVPASANADVVSGPPPKATVIDETEMEPPSDEMAQINPDRQQSDVGMTRMPPPSRSGTRSASAPRQRTVNTTRNPNVMRVHYNGDGTPRDGGRLVRAGTPADREVRQAGENEGVLTGPNGEIKTAHPDIEITPEKLDAMLRNQGPYRGPQPQRTARR